MKRVRNWTPHLIWELSFPIFLVLASVTCAQGKTPIADDSHMICGPRCVQFVLNEFGQNVDLIDVVKEIQWPLLEEGSSLEQLAGALQTRGLHTQIVEIGRAVRLRSNEPVIVHMTGRSSNESFGHFVVWLPTRHQEQLEIWDGLNGIKALDQAEFAATRSGTVLLISRSPISSLVDFIRPDWQAAFLTSVLPMLLPIVCATLVGGGFIWHTLQRRCERRLNVTLDNSFGT